MSVRKLLILDGIGGVPLGRELRATFAALGREAVHVDCLCQPRRAFHGLRSAYAKVRNKRDDRDGFHFLPKLVPDDLRQLIARERPSHILVVGFIYKFHDPRLLRQLADECGARLCLYDTDSCNLYGRRREFIFFVEQELPAYSRIFSFSAVTTRFFRDTRGLDAVHMPFGALPIDLSPHEQSIDVLFVGSGDLRRIFLLEGVRDRVTVRGNRWQRNFPLVSAALRDRIVDRPVWNEELRALLGAAKIVLNITRSDFYGVETGINLRIFEALAAGCFLLTDHCDEVAQLFRVGEEIETFRSSGELADKVAYYIENPERRLAIARKGHAAFLREHTWEARVGRQMMPWLEGR
jgi:spore maturation protein CgeB